MSTSKHRHVLVDLETLGTGSNAAILAIGAVEFDPYGSMLEENSFYSGIDIESAMTLGKVDGPTIKWWLRQSDAARKAITEEGLPGIDEVLADFLVWYQSSEFTKFWCYGATFDAVILTSAYERYEEKPPFSYRDVRCARTLLGIAGMEKTTVGGVEHHALHDAQRHATDVQLAYKKLGLVNGIN